MIDILDQLILDFRLGTKNEIKYEKAQKAKGCENEISERARVPQSNLKSKITISKIS
jgi:hypothetical protein